MTFRSKLIARLARKTPGIVVAGRIPDGDIVLKFLPGITVKN